MAGIASGLLGIGGGILIVPALLALGHTYNAAIAISSISITMTAIMSTWQNFKNGSLKDFHPLVIGIPGMIAASFSARYVYLVHGNGLQKAFAGLLIFNAFVTFFQPTAFIKAPTHKHKLSFYLLIGTVSGLLSGLFGIGGGVVIVPMLIILLGTSMKEAVPISLAVVVLNSASATFVHLSAGHQSMGTGFLMGVGGVLGSLISARLFKRIQDKKLKSIFSFCLVLIACYTFYKAG